MMHSRINFKVKTEEVSARPLASDLLCERGYCHGSCQWLVICERGYCQASCQWLAMWERLLPCLLSVTCYMWERLLPCLLSVTCYMRERLLPDLLSVTWHVREVTARPLPATWYVKHTGILRQSDHYNHLEGCLVLRLVWILIWHVSSASQPFEYSASILLVCNEM